MLGLFIRKEILDNLLNMRFLVACAVSVVLVLSSLIVLTKSYEAEWKTYQSSVRTQDDFIETYGHYNRLSWMSRQPKMPSRFQALVLGIDREAQEENFVSNPIPALLSRLDFVSIVTIIMSLMAILFSYNAISAEREAGMLRQIFSAGVSRRSVLLGKFVGGTFSLLVPFTVGVLGGLLYLVVSSDISLRAMDFGVFLALILISWTYISAFFGLGLFISSCSATSGEAIVRSLFGWVLLVLVVPNISPFLAAELYPVPSAARIHQEEYQIRETERDDIVRERGRELVNRKFVDLTGILAMNQTVIQDTVQHDPVLRARYSQYAREYDAMVKQVNREQQDRADKLSEDFVRRSKHQEGLAKVITSLSPFSNFIFAATDMTETGIEGDDRWAEQVGRYDNIFGHYADEKYRKEMEKNPAFGFNDYLDMRDRPRFRYEPSSITERSASILTPFGILLAFNLIFLAGAFACFIKYDVR